MKVRQATIINWMILGVYFTRELLFKMKKVKSDRCYGCETNTTENLGHFLIHCPFYQNIREKYLPKFLLLVILSILDPLSSKLPDAVKKGWSSVQSAYEFSHNLCSDMHKKRDKFYNDLDKDNK